MTPLTSCHRHRQDCIDGTQNQEGLLIARLPHQCLDFKDCGAPMKVAGIASTSSEHHRDLFVVARMTMIATRTRRRHSSKDGSRSREDLAMSARLLHRAVYEEDGLEVDVVLGQRMARARRHGSW
jgi:hypothetical protein